MENVLENYTNLSHFILDILQLVIPLNRRVNRIEQRTGFLKILCTMLHFENVNPVANDSYMSNERLVYLLLQKLDKFCEDDYDYPHWKALKKRYTTVIERRGYHNNVVQIVLNAHK